MPEKEELVKTLAVDAVGVGGSGLLHGPAVAAAQGLRPFVPGLMFEFPFQGGVEGIVLQPVPVVQGKGGEFLSKGGKPRLFQLLPGQ